MKRKMLKGAPLVAAITAVLAITVSTAAASNGTSRQVIFDNTSGNCTVGLTTGTPTSSSALINIVNGKIDVTASLKGLDPFTVYDVDVVQVPSGESCVQTPGEATLTTNRQGNGNIHYSEPILSGSTGAFVMLIPRTSFDILATPTVSF